jgi:hypothetical protein
LKTLKTRFALLALVLLLNGCSQSPPPEPAKLSYLWTLPSSGGEVALSPETSYTPGQAMTLHVATGSQPATVVVAAFQDETLSLSPPPTRVPVAAGTETSVSWTIPEGQGRSKVFAVFMPSDGESSLEIAKTIEQCLSKDNTAAAQRLYDLLSEWAGQDRSGSNSAGAQVVELGAALSTSLMNPQSQRSGNVGDSSSREGKKENVQGGPAKQSAPFDWRKSSRQVVYGADVHPVVIYGFASSPR